MAKNCLIGRPTFIGRKQTLRKAELAFFPHPISIVIIILSLTSSEGPLPCSMYSYLHAEGVSHTLINCYYHICFLDSYYLFIQICLFAIVSLWKVYSNASNICKWTFIICAMHCPRCRFWDAEHFYNRPYSFTLSLTFSEGPIPCYMYSYTKSGLYCDLELIKKVTHLSRIPFPFLLQ